MQLNEYIFEIGDMFIIRHLSRNFSRFQIKSVFPWLNLFIKAITSYNHMYITWRVFTNEAFQRVPTITAIPLARAQIHDNTVRSNKWRRFIFSPIHVDHGRVVGPCVWRSWKYRIIILHVLIYMHMFILIKMKWIQLKTSFHFQPSLRRQWMSYRTMHIVILKYEMLILLHIIIYSAYETLVLLKDRSYMF